MAKLQSRFPKEVPYTDLEFRIMKKLLLTASAITIIMGSSAYAADLPSKKAPPVAPPAPPMWTGFYAGLNAGGTFGNNSALNGTTWNIWQPPGNVDAVSAALLSGSGSNSGNAAFIGGGQIGYNWQINYNGMGFVSGIEADIQGLAGSGGNGNRWRAAGYDAGPFFNPGSILSNQSGNSSLNYIGTVRGRLGYIVMPQLLVYGTGGLAYGGINANIRNTQMWSDNSGLWNVVNGSQSYSNTMVGWTAGGGVEWMFLPNWSAKAEYLYYDLGRVSTTVVNTAYSLTPADPSGLESSTNYLGRVSGNIIRAGVNYHFNFGPPAPVVAKY